YAGGNHFIFNPAVFAGVGGKAFRYIVVDAVVAAAVPAHQGGNGVFAIDNNGSAAVAPENFRPAAGAGGAFFGTKYGGSARSLIEQRLQQCRSTGAAVAA